MPSKQRDRPRGPGLEPSRRGRPTTRCYSGRVDAKGACQVGSQYPKYAELNDDALDRVKALELELDACLVAFKPEFKVADLDRDQLTRLRALEQEIGAELVCYRRA
mgnify:FL=1